MGTCLPPPFWESLVLGPAFEADLVLQKACSKTAKPARQTGHGHEVMRHKFDGGSGRGSRCVPQRDGECAWVGDSRSMHLSPSPCTYQPPQHLPPKQHSNFAVKTHSILFAVPISTHPPSPTLVLLFSVSISLQAVVLIASFEFPLWLYYRQ